MNRPSVGWHMVGHRNYTKQDVARLLKAQTFEGRYCPRLWMQEAIHNGLTPDDICRIISEDCVVLGRAYNDLTIPFSLRSLYRAEQYQRRSYGLPASGCPYVEYEDLQPAPPRFGDNGDDKSEGLRIGFYDLLRNNTANTVSIFEHLEKVGRGVAIKKQSEALASRLEALGVPAYRKNQGNFSKVGLLTGLDETLSQQFRNLLMIPSVMVSQRGSLRNEIKFWLENLAENSDQMRYLVITCGENVPRFGALKDGHKKWCKKISRIFVYLKEVYGVRLYYRNTEFTKNGINGSVNMHMNLLYSAPFIENWSQFLEDIHVLMGCIVKDAGRLNSVDEVVKYVTKPGDITSMDDEELVWFYRETMNTRLFQTYDTLKDFRSDLKENKLRVVFDASSKKLLTMRKRVVNDRELFTKHDEEEAGSCRESYSDFGSDVLAALLAERNIIREKYASDDEPVEYEEENKIVGLMLPHSAFFNITEPCLMVRNYTTRPESDLGKEALNLIYEIGDRLRNQVSDKLEALGCRAILEKDFRGIRRVYNSGNRDVFSLDESLKYILDTLHDISPWDSRRPPDKPPKPCNPAPSPQWNEEWEQGLRAPVA